MPPPDLPLLLENVTWVRALARRLVADSDRADDVAQEVWAAALERPPREAATIRLWLRSVATRIAGRSARADGRRDRRHARAARPELVASAADLVERAQLHRVLVDEVLALDEPSRSTILFHFFEGLSAEEIGLRAGVPAGTVRVRLHRALEKLRERLDARSGGDRASWTAAIADLGGTIAMATAKTKGALIGVAAALALLGAGGLWVALDPGSPSQPPSPLATPTARAAEPERPASTAAAPAAEPAPRVVAITGRVVDRAAHPVAGARLVVFRAGRAESVRIEGDDDAGVRATSDADGRFSCDGLETGVAYSLVAEADGFAPASHESAHAGSEVVIELFPASAIRGFVRDLASRPIAGAEVTWRGLVRGARVERRATSGADGAYRLADLPTSQDEPGLELLSGRLAASADGFAPVVLTRYGLESPGERVHDLYLTVGATIRGRVVDQTDGSPIAGATVRLIDADRRPTFEAPDGTMRLNPFVPAALAETACDGEGRFELRRVPAWGIHNGSVGVDAALGRLEGSARGFAHAFVGVVLLDAGATFECTIECPPAATVVGRVVDAAGSPIPDAVVAAGSEDDTVLVEWTPPSLVAESASARTDAAGAYRLTRVPSRRGVTSTAVLVAAVKRLGIESEARTTVSVVAGSEATAPDIVMPAVPSVVVRVRDDAGAPVAGAVVRRSPFGDPAGVTDSAGEAIVRFPPWENVGEKGVSLFARAEGFAIGATEPVVPSADDPPAATITLAPESRIAGRVERPDGESAECAVVEVAIASPDSASSSVTGHAGVEADGSFEVAGLPAGPFEVSARDVRGGERAVASDVPAGERELRLVLPETPAAPVRVRLEGTIRDRATGEPLLRASVVLMDRLTRSGFGSTIDAPGHFTFGGVPPNVYELKALAKGYLPITVAEFEVTSASGDAPIDLALEKGRTLRGVVRAAAVERFLSPGISLVDAGGSVVVAPAIEPDGTFEIVGLRAGAEYFAIVHDRTKDGDVRAFCTRVGGEIRVPADESDGGPVVIEVVPAGGLYVDLRGAFADGAAPATVEIAEAGGRLVRRFDGLVSRDFGWTLPVGEYVATLRVPGHEPIERRFRLEAEGESVSFRRE